jgi:hypothetical protein
VLEREREESVVEEGFKVERELEKCCDVDEEESVFGGLGSVVEEQSQASSSSERADAQVCSSEEIFREDNVGTDDGGFVGARGKNIGRGTVVLVRERLERSVRSSRVQLVDEEELELLEEDCCVVDGRIVVGGEGHKESS